MNSRPRAVACKPRHCMYFFLQQLQGEGLNLQLLKMEYISILLNQTHFGVIEALIRSS